MARVLGMSKAGYDALLGRPVSAHAQADAVLLQRVCAVHATSRETDGSPRVHADMRAGGERHGRKRVARLMRDAGRVGASRRRHGPVTTQRDTHARPVPDLVDRKFAAAGPDELWVADVAFVPAAAGFSSRAVVLDACSRRIVGWSMTTHLRAELVVDALQMAIGRRHPSGNVAHHGDQGSQSPRWRLAPAARRLACGPRWAPSATLTTTPCARASSPPWNASGSNVADAPRRQRRAWPASALLRADTTQSASIPPWATAHPSAMNTTCKPSCSPPNPDCP